MRIDDNYTANSDTFGWTLTFSEERERVKTDGTKEKYTFEDNTYHSSLKQCLIKYLSLSLKTVSGGAKEVLDRINEVELTIKNLKNVR